MLKPLSDHAREYFESHFDEMYELLVTMCKIPAPSNHEEKRAEFCREWFEAMGAKNVYIDDALNVVYPIALDEHDDLHMYIAHTDTVFPDTEPMPVVRDGDRLCCPGVGDDTANLAVLMMVAKYVTEFGFKPKHGIVFAANSGEEGLGNLKGVRKLMETYGDKTSEFVSFDGGLSRIVNRAVGSERYRVEVLTEGGHSFSAFGNRNAIYYLSQMISQLYSIKVPQNGDSKTTFNVGKIEGGTSVNTIAQQAEMFYEYRSDDAKCLAEMREYFNAVIESYRKMGITVNVELIGQRPCMGDVDEAKQTVLREKCVDALEYVNGKKPSFGSSSTDCNIPWSMGIPSACFGVYHGRGAHTREEYVEISTMKKGIVAAAMLILEDFE